MQNHFDLSAANWDTPLRIERAQTIADFIIPRIKHFKNPVGLEFGAGTGLLSFALANYFQSILLVDTSAEMIKQANQKINNLNVSNLKTLFIDLDSQDLKNKSIDIIFCQMTLHHIQNIEKLFQKFYKILKNKGMLVIADLYPEDGSFHTNENTFVHKGLDPQILSENLDKIGFSNTEYFPCLEITKENNKKYPVFILFSYK